MRNYGWPGNVRELENVVRSAVVLNMGEEITPDMLSLMQRNIQHGSDIASAPQATATVPTPVATHHATEVTALVGGSFELDKDAIRPFPDIERDIIEAAIRACDDNISDAARRLHINPSTIHRKMKTWQKT